MAKIVLTPPLRCEGLFSGKDPFIIDGEVIYTCHAVHTFTDLKRFNVDVFDKFYSPKGLTVNDYTEDFNLGASIVTLIASDNEVIYIPDTYINSYPGDSGVNYTRPVLIVDLGMVPSYLDITPIFPGVIDVIKKTVGITAEPYIPLMDVDGTVSNEKHIGLEKARIATIRSYTSDSEELANLKSTIADQEQTINNLIDILKSNGLA